MTTTLLTLNRVKKELLELLQHFPSNHNPESLMNVADDYFEAFIDMHVTIPQFEFALKMVKRECEFFPKIKNFLDQVKAYRANPPRKPTDHRQIGYTEELVMTEEEAADGLEKVQAIIAMASNKMSMDEAMDISERPVVFKGTMKR